MTELLQAGAVPFRKKGSQLEFLLVTSHRGRWIFPKGIVEPGETAEQTALKEVQEEAGIRGVLLPEPVGEYAMANSACCDFDIEHCLQCKPFRTALRFAGDAAKEAQSMGSEWETALGETPSIQEDRPR